MDNNNIFLILLEKIVQFST